MGLSYLAPTLRASSLVSRLSSPLVTMQTITCTFLSGSVFSCSPTRCRLFKRPRGLVVLSLRCRMSKYLVSCCTAVNLSLVLYLWLHWPHACQHLSVPASIPSVHPPLCSSTPRPRIGRIFQKDLWDPEIRSSKHSCQSTCKFHIEE